MNISEHIADFVVGFTHETGAPVMQADESHSESLEILKLSLIDWCAVGIAGIDEPVSAIVRNLALADGGRADCSIFGASQKLPPKAAALVNGATSHALDYDDTHFLHVGHTSVVVFSSALAIAETQGSTSKEFLDASLIGSEVCCYVGQWLGRSHYQAGFHQTATAGTFGATAAACHLLKLNHLQIFHALGLAATRASGLTSQFGTMSKPYHAGMAASNGVEAALLASNGFTARLDGLDCSRGFADTHHAEQRHADTASPALGRPYVFSAVQHKFHACCHGLHASIEALQDLKVSHNLNAASVEAITIQTNPRWLKVCNVPTPTTALESKFSYRHSCALVFSSYDSSALSTYSDECCRDSTLARIRELTQVVADETLSDTASHVHVELADGTVYKASYDLADILPTPIRQQKILQKSRVLLNDGVTDNLWSLIQDMELLNTSDFALFCATAHSSEVV